MNAVCQLCKVWVFGVFVGGFDYKIYFGKKVSSRLCHLWIVSAKLRSPCA